MTANLRAGRVRVAQGITFGVLGVAGSYAGTRLSASIKPDLLLALFAVLGALIGYPGGQPIRAPRAASACGRAR